MQKFETIRQPLLWFWITVVTRTTRSGKICKIVAYGCQTPSAQRRSDQNTKNSGNLRLCQQPRAAHTLRSDKKDDFRIATEEMLMCRSYQKFSYGNHVLPTLRKKNWGFVNKKNMKKENIQVSVMRHESPEFHKWCVLNEKSWLKRSRSGNER